MKILEILKKELVAKKFFVTKYLYKGQTHRLFFNKTGNSLVDSSHLKKKTLLLRVEDVCVEEHTEHTGWTSFTFEELFLICKDEKGAIHKVQLDFLDELNFVKQGEECEQHKQFDTSHCRSCSNCML